jgi:hypothetical protein
MQLVERLIRSFAVQLYAIDSTVAQHSILRHISAWRALLNPILNPSF